ncbi:FAD-dependent monooxygenase [Halobaculum litoreum]|uniref:FAD-dependent monooxygenase n=1 Tax=Halobaculum litoreum TaxID=3031998 RepID=A0ABD5XL38_9EURY
MTGLRRDDDGAVRGVTARDRAADESLAVDARVVVGADGRYSAVRSAAGIDAGLFDSPVDLVWFTLPAGTVDAATQGQIGPGGILVHFGLGAGRLQVGFLLRDGEWPAVREAGFDAFRERVAAVDPAVARAMGAHLDGFADTTLLDVAPGVAPEWTRDGLVLLGDAAHTASPVGAQGNPSRSRTRSSSTTCSRTRSGTEPARSPPARSPGSSAAGGRPSSGSSRSSAAPPGGWRGGSASASACRRGSSAPRRSPSAAPPPPAGSPAGRSRRSRSATAPCRSRASGSSTDPGRPRPAVRVPRPRTAFQA